MTLNKNQKISTIAFCCLLLLMFFLLTPYYNFHQFNYYVEGDNNLRHSAVNDTSQEFYGNFFLLNTSQIVFKKLYFEISILSVVYFLSLIIFKSKNKS